MSITGHKLSSSIGIYQKVTAEEKLEMGQTLAGSLAINSNECKRKRAPETMAKNPENEENFEPKAKLPLVEIPDESDPNFDFNAEDILKIIEQCEKASQEYQLRTPMTIVQ